MNSNLASHFKPFVFINSVIFSNQTQQFGSERKHIFSIILIKLQSCRYEVLRKQPRALKGGVTFLLCNFKIKSYTLSVERLDGGQRF